MEPLSTLSAATAMEGAKTAQEVANVEASLARNSVLESASEVREAIVGEKGLDGQIDVVRFESLDAVAARNGMAVKMRNGNWEEGTSLFDQIDWERTVAYSFGYFGNLYLNLQGREPLGIVSPGREQRQVLARLKGELERWQSPEVDGPLVDGVYEVRELYSGPYVEWGPDLMVVMQNYAFMTRDSFDVPRGVLFSDPMAYQQIAIKHSGNHRMEGVIFMVGDGIAEGRHLSNAHILDVAPTVLHLMGHSIPPYMEGHVLTDAFCSGVPEVRYGERRRIEVRAPTLHRMARQIRLLEDRTARLQATINEQNQRIAEQRRRLERFESLWAVRLFRRLERVRIRR